MGITIPLTVVRNVGWKVTTKNPITGDSIRNKPLSKEGEANWDRIFGKKGVVKTIKPQSRASDPMYYGEEDRIDTIGQNGNDGLHYDSLCHICGKELDKVTECAWTSCPKWLEESK